MSLLRSLSAFLFLTSALLSLPTAQTCKPDNLDGGPCCTPAQPDIPVLKSFTQNSLDLCWRNCNLEASLPCKVRWIFTPMGTTTSLNPCEPQFGRMRFTDPSGALKWRGTIVAQYSRTWDETDFAGNRLQVWRYLVNGDLSPTLGAGPIPCPVPPCAPVHNNKVRVTGYLDVAEDCLTGAVSRAWMLTHACDSVDHAPGFPRAGAFHPDRSYSFVGPAAGFVPSSVTAIAAGATTDQAVRSALSSIPGTPLGSYVCFFEERVQGFLNPLQQLCLCVPNPVPPQHQISNLSVFSACGSSVTTPGGPFLPGYLSMGIGAWTIPTSYPGPEELRWSSGGYDYFDACTGIIQPEVFFGVTTFNGFPAFTTDASGLTTPLAPFFVDQSNSLRFGGLAMNVPFLSEHFLNLNF